MASKYAAFPENRGILGLEGEDARKFLQGLVSNDVTRIAPDHALYSALLTPQGKFLHDFFIVQVGDALLLDCEGARLGDLQKRLSMYKLRSKVTLGDRSADFTVVALFGDGTAEALGLSPEAGQAARLNGGSVFMDPRLAAAGARAILPAADAEKILRDAGFETVPPEAYDRHRLQLGLPDGSRDMEVEKAILLENGFDELNGVDWDKGCYMGQELTARTKHRGLIKKRLVPVEIEGAAPAPGTPILYEGKEAGIMRTSRDRFGLALMRLEAMEESDAFNVGDTRLNPRKPSWAAF
ncbi:MAG: folate-binding protein [Rhodospirillales bacterium]|nr:folate-binding protein [Rhodospirillales bacterium]